VELQGGSRRRFALLLRPGRKWPWSDREAARSPRSEVSPISVVRRKAAMAESGSVLEKPLGEGWVVVDHHSRRRCWSNRCSPGQVAEEEPSTYSGEKWPVCVSIQIGARFHPGLVSVIKPRRSALLGLLGVHRLWLAPGWKKPVLSASVGRRGSERRSQIPGQVFSILSGYIGTMGLIAAACWHRMRTCDSLPHWGSGQRKKSSQEFPAGGN